MRRSERDSTNSIPFYHKMAECKQSQLFFFPDASANLSVGNLPYTYTVSLFYPSYSCSLSLFEPSLTMSVSLLACFAAVTASCTLHTVDLTCYASHVGNFDDIVI